MKKILVLGGTRFFGSHLVEQLIRAGHQVTVASKGNVIPAFHDSVILKTADRNNLDDLISLAELGPFDLIYDQICMSAKNANDACIAFKGKCKKYIFASTGSVYNATDDVLLTEELFSPATYDVNIEDTNPYNYQEAKRQAEAVFFQLAPFDVTMVRFPIVLGVDDYTKRLKFHVDHIKAKEDIFFPNINIKMGFIQSHEAGAFLKFIGENNFTGPVNAVSTGFISLKEMVALIEKKSGIKALIANKEGESNHSPFGFGKDFAMNNELGHQLGFNFDKLQDYLPKLVDHFLAN